MADYFQTYEQGFLDRFPLKSDRDVQPMQMIVFSYNGKKNYVALSLGDFPNNKYVHCLKLNELTINEFRMMTTRFKSQDVTNAYINAFRRSAIDEMLELYMYRLPFINPKRIGSQNFYEVYIKNNQYVNKFKNYRTYKIEDMRDVTVVKPNLKYFGLLPRTIQVVSTTPLERQEFITEHEERYQLYNDSGRNSLEDDNG